MTIQEAIKSGKPFKRKNESAWMFYESLEHILRHSLSNGNYGMMLNLFPSDILADDWEIKQ